MTIIKQMKRDGLDVEWLELMKQARELGMSTEEVRQFLNEKRVEKAKTYGG
ncbi:hypothetical protein GCM10007216_15440 [Thalassobacillus devorans]|uniref:Sin domain-containing protein n=1 Tax=Thalassobacillus devorans TaxID=279813 RepID=A0ABQ1NUT8_9BACI|nr:anti-repressor SinI family protein [Thalassobacillus devorans]NIK28513.1 DNA-binding transcriptional MerR regulator [Thalassobacillus devorans]GGC85643.1 hypothetical protein GCM10007216_15440 [Thalassobacillus devorans]